MASQLVGTAENGPTAHEAPITVLLFSSSAVFRRAEKGMRGGGCGELRKPIRSYERSPQPFELQMRFSLYVRGVKLRGAARNPKPAHEARTPIGPHGWTLGPFGARMAVWWLFRRPSLFHAPRAPNRKPGPLISPSLSFPPRDCNELLPAQVPRSSARCRSTSRLHAPVVAITCESTPNYITPLCLSTSISTSTSTSISHEGLQCLCFERLPQVALEQKTLLHDRNSSGASWIWRGPASGRGGSAHRVRSGRLEPRGGLPLQHLGLGAVPPPQHGAAAENGCTYAMLQIFSVYVTCGYSYLLAA